MICRYEVETQEVILSNPKISDIMAFIGLLFHKDRYVVFSNPAYNNTVLFPDEEVENADSD